MYHLMQFSHQHSKKPDYMAYLDYILLSLTNNSKPAQIAQIINFTALLLLLLLLFYYYY